jgi:uncharacterized protein YyaL (SSP411 family)
VAEALIAGPAEIAVVGPPGDPGTAALHRAALLAAPPGAVIAVGDGTAAAGTPDGDAVPLLRGRTPVAGYPTVYVCRNFTCRMPISDLMELRDVLGYPAETPPDEQRLDTPVA